MSRPQRIQLKRIKGFELPPNTRSVARPSKFGNAFKVDGDTTRAQAVENHRVATLDRLKTDPNYLDELRGKNLACFCPLTEECHVDTLLALANCPRRI